MKSMTDNDPKCRTVLHGKALIEWQFAALEKAGIKDIGIVSGYKKDRIQMPGTMFENKRWNESNMVRSLLSASAWLEEFPCIVSYSDIVYSTKIVKQLLDVQSSSINIAYDKNWHNLWAKRFDDPCSDAESFKLNGNQVIEIGNEISDVSEVEGQYMGLLKFTPSSWSQTSNYLSTLTDSEVDCLDMTTLLRRLIEIRIPIEGIPNSQTWYEVDNEHDLELYQTMPIVDLSS